MHLFLPTNVTSDVLVSVDDCNSPAIIPVEPLTNTILAYSTREFIFTVKYKLALLNRRKSVTCHVSVRNNLLMLIARRR